MPRPVTPCGTDSAAPEALSAGLVDGVVAPDNLLARAQEIARQLAQIPPQVFSLTKQSPRAEALERIERGSERHDQATLEVWSAVETHAHIREYLRRVVRKWPLLAAEPFPPF